MSTLYFIAVSMYTAPCVSHIRNRDAFLHQSIDQRHRHMRLLRDHNARNARNRLTRDLLIFAIKKQPAMVFDCFRILRHHINDAHRYPSSKRIFQQLHYAIKKSARLKNRAKNKKNTASGMDCMQFAHYLGRTRAGGNVSIPQAVWIACNGGFLESRKGGRLRFNTASGMDCMQ